jgi:hypothetical protein
MDGFDERLIPAYARGLDLDQQKNMWGDIKSGEKERMDPHLNRIFNRMLDANTKVNKKTMSEDHILNNIEESMDMSSDITLTSNFINQNTDTYNEGLTNRYLNITPEQQSILDRTKVIGGNYSTFTGSVHSKNRMASSGNKTKRIMPDGEDHKMYEDFHSDEMKKRLATANEKNKKGKNLFDIAKGARLDFLKMDKNSTQKTGILNKIRGLFGK